MAIARFSGLSPFEATSSITAKQKIPAAAGQRPSRLGYGSGAAARRARIAGRSLAELSPDRAPGVERLKTSPSRTLATTSPSQKIT